MIVGRFGSFFFGRSFFSHCTWGEPKKESKGVKTTSEPKKAATPANSHPTWREPNTTSDPKKAATPTNTKAAQGYRCIKNWELTLAANCLGKYLFTANMAIQRKDWNNSGKQTKFHGWYQKPNPSGFVSDATQQSCQTTWQLKQPCLHQSTPSTAHGVQPSTSAITNGMGCVYTHPPMRIHAETCIEN